MRLVASCTPPTGDLAHNTCMLPDWELNPQLFGLQAGLNPLSHTSQGCIVLLDVQYIIVTIIASTLRKLGEMNHYFMCHQERGDPC